MKSATATRFRQWASVRLTEYIVKGFAMDDERWKDLGGDSYWRELLGRIRDIRSSEKVLYRQVLDLFATSVDYDPRQAEAKEFFAKIQNKLHHAAHGHTLPEVILERADADKPFMGLTVFKGDRPVKSEVTVAKDYLNENELRRLNTVFSAFFDAAEFRATNHEPTYMADWLGHLDERPFSKSLPTRSVSGQGAHLAAPWARHMRLMARERGVSVVHHAWFPPG